MNLRQAACALVAVVTFAQASRAEDAPFVPLFNGRDLSGWVNVNCAPGTFTVRDGIIVSTGKPTGVMRTERQYENFVLQVDWRHMKAGGNAGVFVWSDPLTAPGVPFTRAIEIQVLDGQNSANYTSDGDVFSIHGAHFTPDRPHPGGWERCLPIEKRAKPSPEWNHYEVTCNNGDVKLAVNGKVVSGGSMTRPRKGYICLESEGSECHFRNLQIRELPSTNPPESEVARVALPFRPLYTGVDLAGFKPQPGHAGHWQPQDWVLSYDGKAAGPDKNLWTATEFGDFELICDWRWTAEPKQVKLPVILPSGKEDVDGNGQPRFVEVADAGDSGILLRGSSKGQINLWCAPVGSGELDAVRTDAAASDEARAAATPKMKADAPLGSWNRLAVKLRGERVDVELNGQRVIEGAKFAGLPPRGPIGLESHDSPIQFANLFIRELEPEKKP